MSKTLPLLLPTVAADPGHEQGVFHKNDMVKAAERCHRDSLPASPVARQTVFRLAVGFGFVAFALVGVFDLAEWYAGRVSLPRYCGNPAATLQMVRETLSEPRPALQASTTPYAVAAKLIYLVPRQDAEPLEAYLARLRRSIAESCRRRAS